MGINERGTIMSKRKSYIGEIFEGRWKLISREKFKSSYCYVLENIYNQTQIVICSHTMYNIFHGKTNISKVLALRMRKNKNHNYLSVSSNRSQKFVYSKKARTNENIKFAKELL